MSSLCLSFVNTSQRRAPKPENGEKSIFSDLLYCSDCGHKLWHHVNPRNKDIKFFSCSNYKKDTRGTCDARHYVRADAIEQVVMLELKRLAKFLEYDEEAFADMLAEKTNEDLIAEKKQVQKELDRAIARNEDVARLYERLYEDNVSGKITDEMFSNFSTNYTNEQKDLKEKIEILNKSISTTEQKEIAITSFVDKVKKYTEIKEWDNGYLVVMADYEGIGIIEEYIDLVPILNNLYINPNIFLKDIKTVKIGNYEQ